MLFLFLLSGGFTLGRVDTAFESLGVFGQARYLVLIPLLAVVLAEMLAASRWAPREGRSMLQARRWLALVVALHGYVAVSAFWSPEPRAALDQVEAVALVALVLVMVPLVFRQAHERSIEFFFRLAFFIAIVYALAGFVSFAGGSASRMSAFAGGPNVFVRIEATGILAAVFFWAKTDRWRWALAIPPLLVAMVLSGSKGGVLAFALSLPLVLAVTALWSRHGSPVFRSLAIPGLIVASGIVALQDDTFASVWDSRFAQLWTNDTPYYTHRDVIFELAWRVFLAHPVFGVGIDGFRQLVGIQYPHNIALSFASEGGVVGLGLFVFCLLCLVPRWSLPKSLEHMCVLVAGAYHLMAGMFSGYYYDARFMWVFFALYMLPVTQEGRESSRHTRDTSSGEAS